MDDKPSHNLSTKDHDTLVRIEVQLENLNKRFDDLNNSSVRDIAELKSKKLDTQLFNDYKSDTIREHTEHETSDREKFADIYSKLNFHSKVIYMGLGIVAVLQFLAPYIIKSFQ